ncbi:MAG: glycosyltransferase [bacterium]|nr:glycosyltransferase [bacterium]
MEKVSNWQTLYQMGFEVSFQNDCIEEFDLSAKQVAVLVTSEYEGIGKNGGIGTYYTTLSQKLASEGWYIILILCRSEKKFCGESKIAALKHIFSTGEVEEVLQLQPIHKLILSKFKNDDWFNYESFRSLVFAQAIVSAYKNARVYVEFAELFGFGYHTVRAKQAGLLGNNCVTAVTMHSGHDWISEAHGKYVIDNSDWFRTACHYEQLSFEMADLPLFLSYFLKDKVDHYGWKTSHAIHLPYCFPILEDLEAQNRCLNNKGKQTLIKNNINAEKITLVFFGRLEERKGLLMFLEALHLLDASIRDKIQVFFLGKVVTLQLSHLKHLNSQQYIEQELGSKFSYKIFSDLFSQEAIELIRNLHYPIVCLTSAQENFPNTGLEMGQLPIDLIVSDTGGFRETLGLIRRSSCVRWFQPGDCYSLAKAMIQAVSAVPEKASVPDRAFLEEVNQRLLSQRLEHMNQAFMKPSAIASENPRVTIGVVCSQLGKHLLECLASLKAQTYNNLDIVVFYKASAEQPIPELIAEAKTLLRRCKFVKMEANASLGEVYNELFLLAEGKYFLPFHADSIALPFMIEEFVRAAMTAKAEVVVCPQVKIDVTPETINFVEHSLYNLLKLDQDRDLSALFSIEILREFRYCQVRGLQAVNWQILAAAVATEKSIAYYPYPLSMYGKEYESLIQSANLPMERYYLRQYLLQIDTSKWSKRQLNTLLTTVEHLWQSEEGFQDRLRKLELQKNWHENRSLAWKTTAEALNKKFD